MSVYFIFQAYVYVDRGQPLGRSLEQLEQAMRALPGLYFEWDGSLTWANQAEGWQIDAMVYDDGQQVQYVDLHGRAATSESCRVLYSKVNQLFSAWGDPNRFQLLRLPDRQWQNLQAFEKEVTDLADSSSLMR